MKKLRFLIPFLFILAGLVASPQQPVRLIIRADDMGSTHSSNLACIKSYQEGITTSVEVMAVGPWFPEAVKMLNQNPGLDVGLHLAITSEWDNVKWRPLTNCPSLTDKNGYLLPRMSVDLNYPGLSIKESKWSLAEIEQEFRAQIEFCLKNIPQLSHLSGHMGSISFDQKVAELTARLASEYHLSVVDGYNPKDEKTIEVHYEGPQGTEEEKVSSFLSMLDKLEPGKIYSFLEHPGLDNIEMQATSHIGYENVAFDRQGVTDLFTNPQVKAAIKAKGIQLVSFNDVLKELPGSTPEAQNVSSDGINKYLEAVKKSGQYLHSVMILRHGKVVYEHWFGDHNARQNHVMWSVSKTFTATAIGFAVTEHLLQLTDKVISFFPDELPDTLSPFLKEMEIKDLLTMSCGQAREANPSDVKQGETWVKTFLSLPVIYEPGTHFLYNSIGTYVLSAIIQKVTGTTVKDYLYPRLFRPLGICGVEWETSPEGINLGGWGLSIKTGDMAKFGQFMLQKGKWQGQQLLPESWFDEAMVAHITQPAQWMPKNAKAKDSDWLQGYGYQIWRCRHDAYRADGKDGQFIIVLPAQDAVIVTTANIQDTQLELNLIWKYLLPAMK